MNVFAIGETVLDIIFKNNQPVSAKPGGSMLNSSVSLGRLGLNVSFISDFGKDETGTMINDFLHENGVNTQYIQLLDSHNTALALAFLDEKNNASYIFYKDNPAERLQNINIKPQAGDILLFGSFFAISSSVRKGLNSIVQQAKSAGSTIIYDPNFRRPHLAELKRIKPWIIENIGAADIVKASDEDVKLIFNCRDADSAFTEIQKAGCDRLIYTAGSDPVQLRTPKQNIGLEIPEINPLSTIGAGDNFNAGLVFNLLNRKLYKENLDDLQKKDWLEILKSCVSFSANVCLSLDNYISQEFVNSVMGGGTMPNDSDSIL